MTHDGVAAVAALALAPAIGLGVARFAYALVLPDMHADLNWSYADAGWMNTTNALGYLLGASLTARAIAVGGTFRVMVGGAWACVIALAMCAVFRSQIALNAARILAGVGGGFAFVAGGVLAARVAQRDTARASFLLSLFYAGPGLGILLSGLCVPFVLEWLGPGSWQSAWAALAVLSLPLAIVLSRAPSGEAAASKAAGATPRRGAMHWLLAGYTLFGAGYIAYMTFMIAWVQGSGRGAGYQALFWLVVGLAAMASPWVWAGILRQLQHGHAFATLTGVTMAGSVLPLLSDSMPVLLASAALFGSTFFAVVAATTAFVRRNLPDAAWAGAIGALTVAFGIGQILGPITTGALNDQTQNLSSGMWASAILLLLAALVGSRQRDFSPEPVG